MSPTSAWRNLPCIRQKGSLVESAKETDQEDIKLKTTRNLIKRKKLLNVSYGTLRMKRWSQEHNSQTCSHVRTLEWLGEVLSSRQDPVVPHELQTITQVSRLRCLKSLQVLKWSSKKNGNSTGYPSWVLFFPTFVSFHRFLWTIKFSFA